MLYVICVATKHRVPIGVTTPPHGSLALEKEVIFLSSAYSSDFYEKTRKTAPDRWLEVSSHRNQNHIRNSYGCNGGYGNLILNCMYTLRSAILVVKHYTNACAVEGKTTY